MAKRRSRFVLMVTLGEMILNWIVTQILDFIWKQARTRLKRKNPFRNLLKDFYQRSIYITFWYLATLREQNLPMTPFFIAAFANVFLPALIAHQRMHRRGILSAKSCPSCRIITQNIEFLEKFVSDRELYPPFKF